ncbi:aspartyl-phosphate phosphatase Spo0E family protein [Alicyclobacillus tolerans]|uniref:Spo0E like sporulation regulatory protein n=1 Tax=Alicyclobacillus tolerans TaxID=90970 RepID=A0A1M6TRI8_9BACL|nr:aspartyl-phosphate phosphatase Spo0E family protein [Alicyclobacillus montanus]SHK59519.1 Spo0E like sporulation regulatory protein [Alicyclobacillus montanus]
MSGCIDIVEFVRNKMVHMAEARRDLGNPDVVRISQRLDLFIVQ